MKYPGYGLPEGYCVRTEDYVLYFLPTILNANIIIYHEAVYILRSVALSCFEMISCSLVVGNLNLAPRILGPILKWYVKIRIDLRNSNILQLFNKIMGFFWVLIFSKISRVLQPEI